MKLVDAAERLMDEMYGPVEAPNAYFRPSDWCEEPSNFRAQLERIQRESSIPTVEALEWALGKFRGDMRLVSLNTYALALRDVLKEYHDDPARVRETT